ncbi:hypothetical protein H1C71_008484, partial [Ictidomys tridecemlineatus]
STQLAKVHSWGCFSFLLLEISECCKKSGMGSKVTWQGKLYLFRRVCYQTKSGKQTYLGGPFTCFDPSLSTTPCSDRRSLGLQSMQLANFKTGEGKGKGCTLNGYDWVLHPDYSYILKDME